MNGSGADQAPASLSWQAILGSHGHRWIATAWPGPPAAPCVDDRV